MGKSLSQYMYINRFLPDRISKIKLVDRFYSQRFYIIKRYPDKKLHLGHEFLLTISKINKTILVLDGINENPMFNSIICRIIIDLKPSEKEIKYVLRFKKKDTIIKGIARYYIGVKDDMRLVGVFEVQDS